MQKKKKKKSHTENQHVEETQALTLAGPTSNAKALDVPALDAPAAAGRGVPPQLCSKQTEAHLHLNGTN